MKKLLILLLFALPSFGGNLTAKTDYTLPSGYFDTVFVWHNVQLTVPGKTFVKTFVQMNYSALKVHIPSIGELTLSEPLKPAKNVAIINDGLFTSQDIILTGTILYVQNKGTHLIKGNLELGDKNIMYKVSGRTIIEGDLILNGGELSMEGCNSIQAERLSGSGSEVARGTGLIKINKEVTISKPLARSNQIKLCFNGSLTGVSLGAATRGCLNNCENGVSYEGLTFSQTNDGSISVSFTLKEVSGLKEINASYSLDGGASWKSVLIVLPEKVVLGVKYVGTFKIQ